MKELKKIKYQGRISNCVPRSGLQVELIKVSGRFFFQKHPPPPKKLLFSSLIKINETPQNEFFLSPPLINHHLQLNSTKFNTLPLTSTYSPASPNPTHPTYNFQQQPWHYQAMAPKHTSSNSSNNCYGEVIARHANILASCYVVDADTTFLKGFHYSTTGADGKRIPFLCYTKHASY